MAIKNIIAKGIGFAPGTIKWLPTHGFGVGAGAGSKMLWDRVTTLVSGDMRVSSSAGWSDYVVPGQVAVVGWSTNDLTNDSVTATVPAAGIKIYKDSDTSESTSGVTTTLDFDAVTGIHVTRIDTSTDPAFYTIGSVYHVVLVGATIDGKTVNNVLASFTLGEMVG